MNWNSGNFFLDYKALKRKAYFIGALLVVSSILSGENIVEIDLDDETLISTEGLVVNYGNMKLNILDLKKDSSKKIVYLNKAFTSKIYDPKGSSYIEGSHGEVALDGKNGEFYDSYGYIEVGKVTGAEYPNDKLYYGGDIIRYNNGVATIRNGWLTTDSKIKNTKNPKDAGYHLLTENINIEPDKQVTLEGIDLYKDETSYFPFRFPWYRVNIRQGSTVPLFPVWGSDNDFGSYTTWGILYGDKEDKFKGGFAPKYGDESGVYIGRFENWYETERYGITKLNIDDLLVYKKDNGDNKDRKYSVNLLHNYSGEYGTLELDILSATNNMISSLDDTIKDFTSSDWAGLEDEKIDSNNHINFYSLDTDLKGLGEQKDITFSGQVKQVSNKKSYNLMAYDSIDNDTTGDYDLFTDLKLTKENKNYKINSYYNQIDDINPGNNRDDLQSKSENFGFELIDKKNKINLSYDKETGDKWRAVTFIERDSDLKPIMFDKPLKNSLVGSRGDYTLLTVPEYDKDNTEKLVLSVGDYELYDNLRLKTGYNNLKTEKELAIFESPFRKNSVDNNTRDKELNRYNNIAYKEIQEEKGWIELSNENNFLTISGGNSKEIIWDRDGYYNYSNFIEGEAYTKYINESSFAEIKLENRKLEIGKLGIFKPYIGARYEDYKKGSVTGVESTELIDSSLKTEAGLEHTINLYDGKSGDIDNKFNYSFQKYDEKNIRLATKENFHKFSEEIEFNLGNTKGKYIGKAELVDSANDNERKYGSFDNKLIFDISEKETLSLNYITNKRFTNENTEKSNKNDLTLENFGASYKLDRHNFSYRTEKIDSNIWKIKDRGLLKTDDSKEIIKTDFYNYSYNLKNKDRFGLNYIVGTDERDNLTLNKKEIDIKKLSYGASYFDYGIRYENNYGMSYGKNRYGKGATGKYSSDTYSLSYSFLDKSMDEEFLKEYAMREFDKDYEELTNEDLDRISSIMKGRAQNTEGKSTKFDLTSVWKRPVAFTGDYTRRFSIDSIIEKNKEKDSIEDFTVNLGYSQRRIGIGYSYSEEIENLANWDNSRIREHLLTLNTKIGKPSEGYRVTTYAKFKDHMYFQEQKKSGKSIGIELGKEMGYYEWSIAYLREYDYGTRDYEWKVALQFTLLTFPDKSLFGLGAKRKIGPMSKTKGIVSIMDGIKADDVDID
ncbi:MAG: hypothetical protein ACRC6K_04850 [Fusobacteriaceae bacterium]